MWIDADCRKRELAHVGLGDDHRPTATQPAYDCRVGFGGQGFVGENFRAGARRLAGNVEQILDADDRAVERAERYAIRRPRVGRVGRRPCGRGINRQTGARTLPFRLRDAKERMFETIATRKARHGGFQEGGSIMYPERSGAARR